MNHTGLKTVSFFPNMDIYYRGSSKKIKCSVPLKSFGSCCYGAFVNALVILYTIYNGST